MQDYQNFYDFLEQSRLKPWAADFRHGIEQACGRPDGNAVKWREALALLPEVSEARSKPSHGGIILEGATLNESELERLRAGLFGLCPWRKGPLDFFGVEIDTEWRSDVKWNRIVKHVKDLKDRYVLDVGCGNGFYMMKMAQQQPKLVLGVDPMSIFVAQFAAANKYLKLPRTFLLPLGFEALPEKMKAFDTVFCLGVFYHRKSPFEFLTTLREYLRPGGELVFETLTVDGDVNTVLVPEDRYAKMRNVWFLPSELAMEHWLKKAGFKEVRLVDNSVTTIEEQRATEWMTNESLSDFLDPNNNNLTVEGLPAPVRSTFVCES
jgi:tRNA (mo5U34)-methyltransferase